MPYIALYRKLRPKQFKDVVGQEHIVRTLMNQIATDRISHAYLFCGTRGTGKTSMAKVFARAVNCENLTGGEPCSGDECEVCKAILAQRSMNVIEIDAASNNGVDNIRDLREEVKYPPAEGKNKVYIIDEVHMLSAGAFNALLKTLEEPPEHVIFILATTDPQKIPATILSRCQRFDFKRIASKEIVRTMKEYLAQAEDISIDDDALQYIARISDGALRDALSVLDQCISFYYGETITLEKVIDIVGAVDDAVLFNMTDALLACDSNKCVGLINALVENGRDVSQFVTELIMHFRNLLVAKTFANDDLTNALDFSADTVVLLKEQGTSIDSNILIEYVSVFSSLQSQLKYASNGRILLEVTCIKVCNPRTSENFEAIYSRLNRLENALENGIVTAPNADGHETGGQISKAIPAEDAAPKSTETPPVKKFMPESIGKIKNNWQKFAAQFSGPMKSFLSLAYPGNLDEKLYIVCNSFSEVGYLKQRESLLKEQFEKVFGESCDFNIITEDEYNRMHMNKYGAKDESFSDGNFPEFDDTRKKINFDIRMT